MSKPEKFEIVALRISNNALASDELPKRLKVMEWGDNPSTKGVFRVTDATAASWAEIQAKHGWDRVAIDYEHNTLEGTAAYKEAKEPREIAGYGTPVVVVGEGVFLEDIHWSKSGERNARNFSDLSPAPLHSEGLVRGLHSVALVRNGAVHGLSFYSASPGVPAGEPTNEGNDTMNESQMLRRILGLPEDADDAAVAEAYAKLDEGMQAEGLSASKAPAADVAGLTSRILTLEGRLTALTANFDAERKRAEIAAGQAAGKVMPLSADEMLKLPLATVKSIVAGLDVTVPLSARSDAPEKKGEQVQGLSAEEREVNRQLGIEDEGGQ